MSLLTPCRLSGGGLAGVHAVHSDSGGGLNPGLGSAGGGLPADGGPEERGRPSHCWPQRAVHGWFHCALQLCTCSHFSASCLAWNIFHLFRVIYQTDMFYLFQRVCLNAQSDSLKKRGSVKAETSLSAVELSGKVRKKGYLLKQVTFLFMCAGANINFCFNKRKWAHQKFQHRLSYFKMHLERSDWDGLEHVQKRWTVGLLMERC